MENFKIILYSTIVFALSIVVLVMIFVRKVRENQRLRQKKLLEQAKLNSTLNEALQIKEKTLDIYRNKV